MACSRLADISFTPDSHLRKLPREAFHDCRSLQAIIIPSCIELIDRGCFQCCNRLSEVSFAAGSNLRMLSSDSFHGCKSLPRIIIPPSLEVIGRACFDNCVILANVAFEAPSKLKTIEGFAFQLCQNLKSISIPSSVEYIGDLCFQCVYGPTFTISSPSRLAIVRGLPEGLGDSFAVPDSVEVFFWQRPLYDRSDVHHPPMALRFGPESRLRAITVNISLPGHVFPRAARIFEQVSSGTLKPFRLGLEFSDYGESPPWNCEVDPGHNIDRECDSSSDE
jgi:hypothetical protein